MPYRDSTMWQYMLGRHKDLRLHMYTNHLLAAISHENMCCVHFTMVGQICWKIDTRAEVSLLFPLAHGVSAGEVMVVVLLWSLHEWEEFLHAYPTHMHHHKDQLQPQYSPYVALINSENVAAQIVCKMWQRTLNMEFLRKQKKPSFCSLSACLSLPCSRYRIMSHSKQVLQR